MKWFWLTLAGILALTGIANASSLTGYACQGWGLTVLAGPYICGAAPDPPTNKGKILLVDGVSFILQTDGTSKICLADGC